MLARQIIIDRRLRERLLGLGERFSDEAVDCVLDRRRRREQVRAVVPGARVLFAQMENGAAVFPNARRNALDLVQFDHAYRQILRLARLDVVQHEDQVGARRD